MLRLPGSGYCMEQPLLLPDPLNALVVASWSPTGNRARIRRLPEQPDIRTGKIRQRDVQGQTPIAMTPGALSAGAAMKVAPASGSNIGLSRTSPE